MTTNPDVTYIGHATVLIEMDGVRIVTDPVLRDRIGHISRQGDRIQSDLVADIDAVLISHMHYDHLDLPSLRRLGRDVRIIAARGCGALLRRDGFRRVEEMSAGDTARVGDVQVVGTHADHDGSRHPFGMEADTLGFLIEGSASIYFAGDTDIFPEMVSIRESLDLALLPVWGWGPTLGEGHLTPQRAAESLRLLRPRAAMPIHWGTFAPIGMGWMRPRFLSLPPYEFAEFASDIAPEVHVHVVHPGNNLLLESPAAPSLPRGNRPRVRPLQGVLSPVPA